MKRKGRGEMIHLGGLFEKYKKTLIAPQKTIIDTFCEVVEDLLSVSVPKNKIKYSTSSKTLSITGGALKSEIKIHKEEILAHMKGRLGEKNAPKEIL